MTDSPGSGELPQGLEAETIEQKPFPTIDIKPLQGKVRLGAEAVNAMALGMEAFRNWVSLCMAKPIIDPGEILGPIDAPGSKDTLTTVKEAIDLARGIGTLAHFNDPNNVAIPDPVIGEDNSRNKPFYDLADRVKTEADRIAQRSRSILPDSLQATQGQCSLPAGSGMDGLLDVTHFDEYLVLIHDINGHLTTINGYAQMARRPGRSEAALATVKRRLAELKKLLEAAPNELVEKYPQENMTVNGIVNKISSDLRIGLPKEIEVTAKIAEQLSTLPLTWCWGHLGRLSINILTNLRKTFFNRDLSIKGSLLATDPQSHIPEPGQFEVALTAKLSPDKSRIFIYIDDNGAGIDPELEREGIQRGKSGFEKTSSGGTGTGLAGVRQRLQYYGGELRLVNRRADGKIIGARMIIELPVREFMQP